MLYIVASSKSKKTIFKIFPRKSPENSPVNTQMVQLCRRHSKIDGISRSPVVKENSKLCNKVIKKSFQY